MIWRGEGRGSRTGAAAAGGRDAACRCRAAGLLVGAWVLRCLGVGGGGVGHCAVVIGFVRGVEEEVNR